MNYRIYRQPTKISHAGGRAGGFTLIELLAAIAVIAVLLAILLPVLGAIRQKAHTAACLSNLRQIGVYLSLWRNANDMKVAPDRINVSPGWPGAIGVEGFELNEGGEQIGYTSDVLQDPAVPYKSYFGHYAFNTSFGGSFYNGQWHSNDIRMSNVENPAEKVTVIDGKLPFPYSLGFLPSPSDSMGHVDWHRHGTVSEEGEALGRFNVLWLDGHVSTETGAQGSGKGSLPMDLKSGHWTLP